MRTIIYLIRHGESIGNMQRKCLGHTDLGLSDLGREQAALTGKELSSVKFDAIYSSDLIRAMETAAPHAELRGMTVIPDAGLRELFFGEWENMYVDDIIGQYGEMYTVSWRESFGEFASLGGETIPELAERMYSTVGKIASAHPSGTVLIATHAAAIRAFWGKASGIDPKDLARELPFPSNASYSIIEYDIDEDVFIPISYSNDKHLEGVVTRWKD